MPELSTLLAQVFTGLVLGMIYVLLAIGLSLIFGLMTVVNFAHGALYMLGAYFAFTVLALTRSFWAALILAPLIVGTLGLLIERFLIRRLSGRSPDGHLMEIAELPKDVHPFMLGTQFHPELKARPLTPHPLFTAFIKAAIKDK